MYYVQYIRTNYVTYRQIFFARELLEYVPVKYLKYKSKLPLQWQYVPFVPNTYFCKLTRSRKGYICEVFHSNERHWCVRVDLIFPKTFWGKIGTCTCPPDSYGLHHHAFGV